MPTVAEYEAWKSRQQHSNVGKANIVLGQDWQQEPDQFAADMNFAKEASSVIGNPVPMQMVSDPSTRNVFERIIAEKKQSTILTQAPKLADWLRVPENAALSRDDLEGLSWWETTTGAAGNAVQRGSMRLPQMYNQWMAEGAAQRFSDRDASFTDIYAQERASVGMEGQLVDTAVGPLTDLWSAGSRFLGSRLSQAFGGDQQAAAAYYQQQAGEIAKQIAAVPMSPAASVVRDQIAALEPTGDIGADVGNFLQVMGSDPAGFTAFLAETAAETAPTLAAAFGVGVATRNPAAVAGTLGGLSGLQERYTAPTEFLNERGFYISTPEGAMAAISDPDLMREAAERGEIRGVIIGSLDAISGGVAGETLARNPLLNLALQSLVQSAFGGGGEAAAQIASGEELNISEVLIEAMAEFVTAPIDVASMASTRYMEGVQKSRAATETTEVLSEIAAQAAASVTRTRSPDTFRDFIATVTANGGRENMFVPADQFVQYFQGAGLDPFELADQLAGLSRDDLETAIETGGSVQIPTATWAADMAGSEHDAFVIQNAAFSPDDMTAAQAAEFEAVKNELLTEAWAEAEAIRQDAEATRAVYDQEREQVIGALRAAGRALDVATNEALPLVAFRRTMAERMGLTPEEFAARYPLPEVRGERPEALNPKNVDALTRTLAEARNRRSAGLDKAGTPLLEFISERGGVDDPGGELAARDAAVVKRPGKKSLRLARGMMAGVRDMFGGGGITRGMDDTARAAVEAGFMADDPDVLAWQEAMRSGGEAPDLTAAFLRAVDAELRGDQDVAVADDLGGIEEYLAGLGLSLEDSDADIRAALEGDEGRAYGQAPVATDAFKRWAGTDEVIEAEDIADTDFSGAGPFVVKAYHGTTHTFEAFDASVKGTKEGQFGAVNYFTSSLSDAEGNYLSGGQDLTNRIERRAEQLGEQAYDDGEELTREEVLARARAELAGEKEQVLEVYIKTEKPFVIGDGQWVEFGDPGALERAAIERVAEDNGLEVSEIEENRDDYEDAIDEARWDLEAETENPLAVAIQTVSDRYDLDPAVMLSGLEDFMVEGGRAEDIEAAMRSGEGFAYAEDPETGDMIGFHVLAEVIRELGYDAIILKNANERFTGMEMEHGTAHIHVFDRDNTNIKSVDNIGTFDANDPRLLFQSMPENPRWSGDGKDPTEWDGNTLSWKLNDTEKHWLAGTDDADQFLTDGGDLILGPDELPVFSELVRENEASQGRGSVPLRFRTYFQADAGFGMGGGARGSIQFPGAGVSNGQTIISLFKSADLSTFLHETGHYFLTVTQDMARMDPSSQVANDLQSIKDWWYQNADAVARDAGNGVTADDVRLALDAGTTGDAAKDTAIDTGMQEQFARATEQYFMEGKAPSVELRGAFERFSAWLVSIYKNLRGLNVQVTDDLRGVFDRLLATDTEIDNARADTGADVELTADDLGMTDTQFASFLRLRDQARDEAKAKALNETMMPIRRAATKAYREERAKVRDRIERETKQQPVYRAIQELRFGKDFDGSDVQPLKLNRGLIEAEYGAGYIPLLPGATKDGSGHRNAVFSTEGGVHPDIAAGAYGFSTGRDLLDALTNAHPLNEVIENETDREMEFRHNDPLKDGSIQQIAMDAIHGDLQGQVLAARLEAFNDIAGTDRGLTHKQARETARRTLRGMSVRDATRADRFLAAERKAAGEVARLSATVTREGMWMDAARRRVEKQARGAVREGDGKAALSLAPKVSAANQNTQRHNEQAAALVEAQRRQLLNHMLYSEARKVAAETEQVVKRVGLLRKANARLSKTRDINFIYAARAVAGKFGLTKAPTDFDFNSWLEQLRFDDPVAAAAMVNTIDTYSQDARHFKDLTVAEFGAVKDAIDSLMTMAKTTRALEIDGQKIDRRDAIDALIAVAEPRAKARAGTNAAPTKKEKSFLSALTTGAALVRTEAWARDMDDGKAGVYTRYLVKPVMDALANYREARKERLDQLLAIVEPRRGELLGAAVAAPEIGYTFENKGALLHALLHTGNESNKRKLLIGRGWSRGMINQKQAVTRSGKPRVDRQGNPVLDKGTLDTSKWDALVARLIADGTITAADKKMVEDIWSLMDAMKRPAQTAHKRIYGHYFAEIEAAPFTNALGTWRGGYVPAIIDQYAAIDAGKQDAAAALDSQMDASMFPTTGSGFTKGRVEYNQPLALNLQSLPGHMDKVLRFTHLEPTIRQTSSLLTDRGLREAISGVNRDAIDAILTPWLVRTARQAVETPSTTASGRTFGNVMRTIRKRVGLHMMAINIVNAAQQVTGIPSAAVLVKVKHLKAATVRYAKDAGAMQTEAIEASAMMRDRMDNSARLTGQEIDKIIVEPTIQAEVDRFVTQHGYILQQGTQNVVDVIVWHSAYDQAVQQGMTGEDAVFEADSVVRRTQGSFNPEDVSAFESGTAFQRVFTMFTSYFNTQLNLIGGEALTTIRTMGWHGKQRLFHLYFFGVMIPAVVAEAISQAARGELGDEDDDGLTDDMLELFLGSQVKFLAGAVPGLGALTVAMLNNFNGQSFDDKLSVSPANYLLERAARAPATVGGAVTGDGSRSRALADGITALGLVLGVPTGQLAKSAGYLAGIAEGKSEPENAFDVARGVMSGRDGTE